jgi:hypothetical protein
MIKLYSIEYSHISGPRAKQTTDINQLSDWLEQALMDQYVSRETIKLYTTERKEEKK